HEPAESHAPSRKIGQKHPPERVLSRLSAARSSLRFCLGGHCRNRSVAGRISSGFGRGSVRRLIGRGWLTGCRGRIGGTCGCVVCGQCGRRQPSEYQENQCCCETSFHGKTPFDE